MCVYYMVYMVLRSQNGKPYYTLAKLALPYPTVPYHTMHQGHSIPQIYFSLNVCIYYDQLTLQFSLALSRDQWVEYNSNCKFQRVLPKIGRIKHYQSQKSRIQKNGIGLHYCAPCSSPPTPFIKYKTAKTQLWCQWTFNKSIHRQ